MTCYQYQVEAEKRVAKIMSEAPPGIAKDWSHLWAYPAFILGFVIWCGFAACVNIFLCCLLYGFMERYSVPIGYIDCMCVTAFITAVILPRIMKRNS